ncbi:hypothetical protein LTR62_001923 [Meristemomyces frigidus]|uniref:SET domain-containing protein n=1 Tax=Meristemomyces frigidus TaxID=1508187 RepID=A0AAN7T8X8_9PEZI|nr:hypothetical protein LTR62_001923 [Meristemomyces frigidus]
MDDPFDPAAYRPTAPLEPGDSIPSGDDLKQLLHDLTQQTRDLARWPYDPETWFARAETLVSLRFPELALGDGWKAERLCGNLLARVDKGVGKWRLGFAKGFWMMGSEVPGARGHSDGEEEDEDGEEEEDEEKEALCERLRDLRDTATLLQHTLLDVSPEHLEGRFVPRSYPWMSAYHRFRSDELLEKVNDEFSQHTCGRGHSVAACRVERNAFGGGADVLGVFATRDMEAGTLLFVDYTEVFGCIGPGSDDSSANLFGGKGCADPLHPNLESEMAWQDLRWIRDRCGKDAADVIMRCRLLIGSIRWGCRAEAAGEKTRRGGHPLDHTRIARLTPSHRVNRKPSLVSLEHDVAVPNDFLLQFGIDVFADERYDTWVLFEVRERAGNNSWGDPIHSCLSPLFAFFNHSCAPNVDWAPHKDATFMTLEIVRNVKAGEQMLVMYDSFMTDEGLAARRKRMRRWLNSDCMCEKCELEEEHERLEAELVKMRARAEAFQLLLDQKKADQHRVDSPLGSRETSSMSAIDEVVGNWDTAPKPIFPEDLE